MTNTVTTRCPRCCGLTYLYKLGGGYTAADNGSPKIVCICCNGTGKISYDIPDLSPLIEENNSDSIINSEIIKEEKNDEGKKEVRKENSKKSKA